MLYMSQLICCEANMATNSVTSYDKIQNGDAQAETSINFSDIKRFPSLAK